MTNEMDSSHEVINGNGLNQLVLFYRFQICHTLSYNHYYLVVNNIKQERKVNKKN